MPLLLLRLLLMLPLSSTHAGLLHAVLFLPGQAHLLHAEELILNFCNPLEQNVYFVEVDLVLVGQIAV